MADVLFAYRADGGTIGTNTTYAVRELKQAIRAVRRSDDPYDQADIENIRLGFVSHDWTTYPFEESLGDMPRIGRDVLASLLRCNRAQFVKFAQWYEVRSEDLAKQLNEDTPELITDTMRRTEALVESGAFPSNAVGMMEASTDAAGPLAPIGSIESAAGSRVGYCGRDGIGIANLYAVPEIFWRVTPRLRAIAFHEFVHNVGHIDDERRGIYFGLTRKQEYPPQLWLEEAFTAMATDEAMQIVLPQGPPGSYSRERLLLMLASMAAPELVHFTDLSEAHFSRRSIKSEARRFVEHTLSSGLNGLFPERGGDALRSINAQYITIARAHERSDFMDKLTALASDRLTGRTKH